MTINKMILVLICTVFSNQSFCQKDKKNNNTNSDLITYKRFDNSTITSDITYFIENILPSNDTNNIKLVMKNRGYSVNQQVGPSTLLLKVLEISNISVLKFFLENGANPNLRVFDSEDYYSEYPLIITGKNKDTIRMNLLIKFGAKLNNVEKALRELAYRFEDFPFHNYVNKLYGGFISEDALLNLVLNNTFRKYVTPELINEYIKRGANVNATGGIGYYGNTLDWTILMHSIQFKLPILSIQELIKQGANVNAYSQKNMSLWANSPLSIAVDNNNFEVVKILIEKGADINKIGQCNPFGGDAFQTTPLGIAQKKGFRSIADYLFSIGAK